MRRIGQREPPNEWLAVASMLLACLFIYHAASGERFWLWQFFANVGVVAVLSWIVWICIAVRVSILDERRSRLREHDDRDRD